MSIEEHSVVLGKRKHSTLISDQFQFCSDGQTSPQGTQKSGFYKTQGKRRRNCRKCNRNHPATDCQGMLITCHLCNQLGHRSYDCHTALPSATKGKDHKGGDQIGQSNCNQNEKNHPNTEFQDDLIGSDGQTNLQGAQKLEFYKTQGQTRRDHCQKCKLNHPATDCQGMLITCYLCNQLGHRSYDCPTALPSKTKGKGRKGGDQIGQPSCNQYGKKRPSTDCQDDLIGCRICGRLGHRYFDCLLTTTGIVNRSHCQTQTLNVQEQPQQETPSAPNNTQSGESKDNVQATEPYPQNVGHTSEVHKDRGAPGGRQSVDDVISVQKIIPIVSKVEPLEGSNYRRWSQRMLILFEALDVDYVLLEDSRTERDSDKTPAAPLGWLPVLAASTKVDAEKKEKYEKDNKTVRSHLLAHMNDVLFDIFIDYSYAKEIWDTLKKHYEGEDIGKRKYVVGNWLHFVMVDNKPIMKQIYEYENLVADILSEGMNICEKFQAQVLLEKVPPSWSDFCNHLRHKRRDLSLQELINHMQIEEAKRLKDKQISYASGSV